MEAINASTSFCVIFLLMSLISAPSAASAIALVNCPDSSSAVLLITEESTALGTTAVLVETVFVTIRS